MTTSNLKVHSKVGLITNSSTTIFFWDKYVSVPLILLVSHNESICTLNPNTPPFLKLFRERVFVLYAQKYHFVNRPYISWFKSSNLDIIDANHLTSNIRSHTFYTKQNMKRIAMDTSTSHIGDVSYFVPGTKVSYDILMQTFRNAPGKMELRLE